jgi:MYXO-CTERM domain-containing protein
MSMRKIAPWTRRVAMLGSLLAVLLVAGVALAAGRIQWSKTTVKEVGTGSWKLELKIFLPRAPDVPHVPMKFEFKPVAYYERAMMDGDKLVERKVPLVGRPDMIEGIEVGFLDPGSGKIEKGTKFSFKVTRAHGFEAGEYTVTIRDGRNGQLVGSPTTLKFEGENEIIDRRAMVFAAPDAKKKKKDEAGGEKKDEGGEAKKDEGGESKDEGASGDEGAGDTGMPEASAAETPPADDDKPGEIKEKPGGCGCRLADTRDDSMPALGLGLIGLALLGARRRR